MTAGGDTGQEADDEERELQPGAAASSSRHVKEGGSSIGDICMQYMTKAHKSRFNKSALPLRENPVCPTPSRPDQSPDLVSTHARAAKVLRSACILPS